MAVTVLQEIENNYFEKENNALQEKSVFMKVDKMTS